MKPYVRRTYGFVLENNFLLKRAKQKPDIRQSGSFCYRAGGFSISVYVLPRKGEVAEKKVSGAQDLLQVPAAPAECHPREIQDGQVDGDILQKLGKDRAGRFAIAGDQYVEIVAGKKKTIVCDLYAAFMRKPQEMKRKASGRQADLMPGKKELFGKVQLRHDDVRGRPKRQSL